MEFLISLTMLGFKLISSSSPLADGSFSYFQYICIHISSSSPFQAPSLFPLLVLPPSFDLLWGVWILLYFAFFCFSVLFLFLFFIGFREIMLNPISLPGHSKPLNHGIYVEDVNVYFSKGRHGF